MRMSIDATNELQWLLSESASLQHREPSHTQRFRYRGFTQETLNQNNSLSKNQKALLGHMGKDGEAPPPLL